MTTSMFKTKIERHPERAATQEAIEILKEGLVAHVGFIDEGLPYVIPMSYEYDAELEAVYLHGSLHSRALKLIAAGAPVCLEITLLEGLVYSKAAMFHSMNYRSALAFGHGQQVTAHDEMQRVFAQMISRYFEGRQPGIDYLEAPAKHLDQTLFVKVQIDKLSAKQRQGGPNGPKDRKPDAIGSAGVVTMPRGCPFHAQSNTQPDTHNQTQPKQEPDHV